MDITNRTRLKSELQQQVLESAGAEESMRVSHQPKRKMASRRF